MLKKLREFFTKKPEFNRAAHIDACDAHDRKLDEQFSASAEGKARAADTLRRRQKAHDEITPSRRVSAQSSLGAAYGRRREMEEIPQPDPYLPIAMMALAQDTSPVQEERYTPDYGCPTPSSSDSSSSSSSSYSSSDYGSSSSYDSGSSASDSGSSSSCD